MVQMLVVTDCNHTRQFPIQNSDEIVEMCVANVALNRGFRDRFKKRLCPKSLRVEREVMGNTLDERTDALGILGIGNTNFHVSEGLIEWAIG